MANTANVFKGFSMRSLVLLIVRKQNKVCDGAFFKKERQLIDENRKHAPSANAAENWEICNPSHSAIT